MIHIINRLQLSDGGLVVRGTKQKVHLQQGTMDGACAVYSMMMCLIIIRSINRNDVACLNDEKIKGNTSKGRLINTFLHKNGFVRKGFFITKLNDELLHAYQKSVDTEFYSISKNGISGITDGVVKALESNIPVELGFIRKGYSGHAVVAVGYEEISTGYLFYILDPGYPMHFGQYWNNVIRVETNSIRKYNAYNFEEKENIQIDEALVIRKKQK